MTGVVSLDDILAVLAGASAGDAAARVALPPDAPPEQMATRLAIGLNLLLEALAEQHGSQLKLEGLVASRDEQIRQSEQKFSKAFRASPAAISIATLPDGHWVEINEALVQMTGYSREEALGHTSAELGLVDAAARAVILESIKEHGYVRDVEIRMRTKSQQLIDVLVSVEEVELNGQACALTIQYDITELRRAEREVRRLNDDLEQRQAALEVANRELEAFSYSVAHDLRAPLRRIDGFSQALLEDYGPALDAAGQDYLQRVRESAKHMAQLIEDLLMLSRVTHSELRREPTDLSALARATGQHLRGAEPQRPVALVVAEGLSALADAHLLGIVLENLLGNAWKFTRQRPLARIEVGTQLEAGRPVYFVRDNGAGFDMAYADKLFGAFQRLHSGVEFEGTGIGLAIVQRIITRHGGRIWAEAQVNQGASFYFTL